MDLRAEQSRLEAALAGGDEAARIPLGCVLEQLGEHDAALAVLEGATSADPRQTVEAALAVGRACERAGQPERAQAALLVAVERATGLGKTDPLAARACWELGRHLGDQTLIERAAQIWVALAQPAWALRARARAAALRGEAAGPIYQQAIAALDLAIGAHPLLVEVLIEAAAHAEPRTARAMRERAVELAQATTGPTSPRTLDAWWTLAHADRDPSVLAAARGSVAGDLHAEATLVYLQADLVAALGEPEAALRLREESLELREQALGASHAALITLSAEIKQGWDALGRPDEAVAFLRRCRARVPAESWVFRNLTYSIGYALAALGQHDEYVALWRDFLAQREAACAPDSPELEEARRTVAEQLADVAAPAAFEPHLSETLDDVAAYLALADELIARGDPRGELIVVQHQLRAAPADAALLARQHALLEQHRDALLGPVPADAVAWHLGFFRSVELDLRHDPEARLLRALLAHPSATYLHELRVLAGYVEGDYPEQATNAPAILEVLAAEPRRSLRALALVQRAVEPIDGFTHSAGCTHAEPAVWAALPRLERLHLGGVDIVHALAHPGLEHLELDDRPICPAGAWDLPRLQTLVWSLTGATLGVPTDVELDAIDPVWHQPLPALRELVLRGSFYDCGGSLDRDEILARVRTLDRLTLPASALDDDWVDTLRRHAPDLRTLSALRVTGADLGDPRVGRLQRELPNLELSNAMSA